MGGDDRYRSDHPRVASREEQRDGPAIAVTYEIDGCSVELPDQLREVLNGLVEVMVVQGNVAW